MKEGCKDLFEVEDLIQWMKTKPESNSDSNETGNIQLKKCPKCIRTIRHTQSPNTFIQASLRDIEQVKKKTCGSDEANLQYQRNLYAKIEQLLESDSFVNDPLQLRYICNDMQSELKCAEPEAGPSHEER